MPDAIREVDIGRIIQSPYREPLYDTVMLENAVAARQVAFFQVPQGQPLSGIAGFVFPKSKAHTNIMQAGAAGRGRDQLITGIQLLVMGAPTIVGSSVTVGNSPALGDILGLYTFSWLELGISKTEIEVRLDRVCTGPRIEGNIYPAAAAGETVTGNGMALVKEYYSLHIPFKAMQKSYGGYMFYKGDMALVCRLNFDPTFTPTGDLVLVCYLLGIGNKPL